jgi:hypothetical protein
MRMEWNEEWVKLSAKLVTHLGERLSDEFRSVYLFVYLFLPPSVVLIPSSVHNSDDEFEGERKKRTSGYSRLGTP